MMENKFFLVGAGGFAREIYSYISDSGFQIGAFSLGGFLDDNQRALDRFHIQHDIVSSLFSEELPKNSKLLMAVANPILKEKLYNHYNSQGYQFLTFVHDSAVVGRNVVLGEGVVIAPNSTLTTDIQIGRCVTVNALATVGHDASIGDFSTLSGHCDVTGFVEMGAKVFMGSHATIIPNVKVGNSAIVGAGSVVISRVRENTTVFGNPAKKIK